MFILLYNNIIIPLKMLNKPFLLNIPQKVSAIGKFHKRQQWFPSSRYFQLLPFFQTHYINIKLTPKCPPYSESNEKMGIQR